MRDSWFSTSKNRLKILCESSLWEPMGYVSHSEAASTLIHAIRSIATNQLWIPTPVLPAFLREVNNAFHKHACARQTTSPREDEILELVRRRLSNREIADFCRFASARSNSTSPIFCPNCMLATDGS